MLLNIELAEEFAELIRDIHQKGWSPATSTNYSFLNNANPTAIAITQSGVDKSKFGVKHWMLVNEEGRALNGYEHFKPLAETLLHTILYKLDKSVRFVFHTHSVL